MDTAAESIDLTLAEELSQFYADPLGFVLFAYPWNERGELAQFEGPDQWQRDFLNELGRMVRERAFDGENAVMPIRMATASGHGIGKSALVAWVVDWIMSTRPHAQGTVTANTFTQLQTKTWAQIQRWTGLMVHKRWFAVTGERMYHRSFPATWFCSAQSCKEENSEAFAGQHAAASTSFYVFDEGSAVSDKIYEVAEGGLTDGEPMEFVFGNPTRNTGQLYRACFGSEVDRWNHRSIDSRNCKIPNKEAIAEWEKVYGEESDFFRVRVLGLPPAASELQYIDRKRVEDAEKRTVQVLRDEPVVAGFDVSGGGAAWNVIRFRRGLDGDCFPPVRIPGEKGRDRGALVGKCSEILKDPKLNVAAMFVDSAFGSPIVERLKMLGFKNVHEVNFGGDSPDIHQANYRAYMYSKAKDWLLHGSIPPKPGLETENPTGNLSQQLCLPGYHINRQGKLVMESKADIAKRGEQSPDDADAFVLTFAQTVAPKPQTQDRPKQHFSAWS